MDINLVNLYNPSESVSESDFVQNIIFRQYKII